MEAPSWISAAIVAVPLIGLAGSAIAFVVKLFQDAKERRHKRFFDLMTQIDGAGPIATKLAAIYALRDFVEHGEFVERFCKTLGDHVQGGSSQAIVDELNKTAAAIAKSK
jgi:lysyl-tRNA synthetase class II